MNKTVPEMKVQVEEGVTTMNVFLEDAAQQFNEIKAIVDKYEAWGAQYG